MAIAYVRTHGTNGGTGSATTVTRTIAATVPVGNHLVMGIASGTSSDNITSVTDSQSNTYQVDRREATTARVCFIASARITTQLTTSDTITVTFVAPTVNRIIAVDEYSGMKTSGWLDSGKVNSGTGNSTTPDSGNVTTTTAGSLLYGAGVYGNAGVSYAPGTTNSGSYTYIESNEQKLSSAQGLETEYYIGAAASVTVSANGTITSAVWTQAIAVYLPAVSTSTQGLWAGF